MPFPFNPQDIRQNPIVTIASDPGNPFQTTAPLRALRPPPFPATNLAADRPQAGLGFRDPGPAGRIGLADPNQAFPDPGPPAPSQPQPPSPAQRFNQSPFQVVGTNNRSGAQVGGRSFSRLAPAARFDNVSQHAIVLEDTPVGPDSRLEFESFPGEWVESYQLKAYRKMGGHRMPQPQFATYQGGDWGPFPLTLTFRAGINDGSESLDPNNAATRDIESILITMERKVNWLVALAFPLERTNTEAQRFLRQQVASGAIPASAVSEDAISKFRRNDPPFVLLVLGTWRVIRGYLMGIEWRWTPPFHPISGRPYGAVVSMQFQPIQPSYPTWQSIRNQAGTTGQAGPITDRLPPADRQRIVVTNNLLQRRAAAASGTALPVPLLFDPEPSDGLREGGGTVGRRPFGSQGAGATPFGQAGTGANPF